MSDLFSDQIFIFSLDYFSSLGGRIGTMKILVKKSLRQKSLAEKNSSHTESALATLLRAQSHEKKSDGCGENTILFVYE
jgi:hypothetical protein